MKEKSDSRSHNMSHVKGKDTSIELKVRKYLFCHGFRYRKNDRKLPGCPDIVLPKYRCVIFINGCFWHHHYNCKYAKMCIRDRISDTQLYKQSGNAVSPPVITAIVDCMMSLM